MTHNTDIATRAFVVSLKAPFSGKTTAEVADITGLPKSTINKIYARAIARGFDPNRRPITIRDCHLEDAFRSGRPTKCTEEAEEAVIAKVRRDRYGREKTCAEISGELNSEGLQLSATSVGRVLKTAGIRRTKPMRKAALSERPGIAS